MLAEAFGALRQGRTDTWVGRERADRENTENTDSERERERERERGCVCVCVKRVGRSVLTQ